MLSRQPKSKAFENTPTFETLENRQLMSVTLINHTVIATGTAGNDVITISQSGNTVKVTDNGVPHSYQTWQMQSIVVTGEAGNDTITATDAVTKPLFLHGNGGSDTLRGGGKGDYLDGGANNDTLDGGPGADDLHGGGGFDTLTYAGRSKGVIVMLDDEAYDGALDNVPAVIESWLGLHGADWSPEADNAHSDIEEVIGTSHADFIAGSDGDNVLIGNGGNDLLMGSGGADVLFGGDGNDFLYASWSGPNIPDEVLDGKSELVYGGDGDDQIFGTEYGPNSIYGGGGDDYIRGGMNADHLYGNSGNDTLDGENGDDDLHGGDDNDTLDGGEGADDLHGDAGVDTLDYSGRDAWNETTFGVTVTLDDLANDGKSLGDISFHENDNAHTDIENVNGTRHNDILIGSSANNVLHGNAGNDKIYGNGGVDVLYGDDGSDRLYAKDGVYGEVLIGGDGDDWAWFDNIGFGKKDFVLGVEHLNA